MSHPMQNGRKFSYDVSASLPNPHLKGIEEDHLYHLGYTAEGHDLPALFGDIKFVCCGGSAGRMEKLATYLLTELNMPLPYGAKLVNLSYTDRFVMYKAGPVLCVNHGIGVPSMSIMLHEVFKLLAHAGCGHEVIFFRLGTSGGIGIDPGTVVVADGALNGLLEAEHEFHVLGKRIRYPTTCDINLSNEVYKLASQFDFPVLQGKTMGTDDFYEGQGRLDGALCVYSEKDKFDFLNKALAAGARNIEMEATAFFVLTRRAGFKAAIVCVTIINRLITDQVTRDVPLLKSWEERPLIVVASFIKQQLKINNSK